MKVHCGECDEQLDVPDPSGIEDHIRVMHPDRPEIERWPDGEVVIHDQELPEDS